MNQINFRDSFGPGLPNRFSNIGLVGNLRNSTADYERISPWNVMGNLPQETMVEAIYTANGLNNSHATHTVLTRLPQPVDKDSGADELLFALHFNQEQGTGDRSVQVMSLSKLNLHLSTRTMRQKYGTQFSAHKLLRRFSMLAVQVRDWPPNLDGDDADVSPCTVIPMGVIEYFKNWSNASNTWNPSAGNDGGWESGADVKVGYDLYLILQRVPFTNAYLEEIRRKKRMAEFAADRQLNRWLAADDDEDDGRGTNGGQTRRGRKAVRGANGNSYANVGLSDILSASDEKKTSSTTTTSSSAATTNDDQEYMWQLSAYVSRDGQAPPVGLYVNCKNYIGAAMFVGRVHKLYGDHIDAAGQFASVMKSAIHPSNDSTEYRDKLRSGNMISLEF